MLEFFNVDDPNYGKGDQVGKNAFLDKGIYHRFYTLDELPEIMSGFNIQSIDYIWHSDPGHTDNYPRTEEHSHCSYFVLAEKVTA